MSGLGSLIVAKTTALHPLESVTVSTTEGLVDARAGGSYFWITYLPKYLGGGTFYLTGLRDSEGNFYDGNSTYKINVPADTPVKDFWSVIAYSMKTKGFINGQPEIGKATRDEKDMVKNADGSFDIYIGKKAPKGMESNFIPSGGEDFFLLFRLYGLIPVIRIQRKLF